MNLSEHFTLEECVASQTATRLGIAEQFTPPESVIDSMKLLAEKVMEPVRAQFGSYTPSSCYRCPKLNKAVKGSATSQHVKGEAIDIDLGRDRNAKLLIWAQFAFDFDQIINEFPDAQGRPSWVHISYKAVGNRKQVLTIK